MSERRFRRDLVLVDASPLIALSIIQGFDWLHSLLGKITTTSVVLREAASGQRRRGEPEILQVVRRRRIEVVVDEHREPTFDELDAGEASILRLAVHSRRHCLILIDERAGSRVAREHGFPAVGTAGLLIQAKRRGLVPAVRPALEAMRANDFRLSSELVRAVLREAGEA